MHKPEPAAAAQPQRAPVGRPTLRTEEILTRILQIIRQTGISDSAASVRAGLTACGLARWKQRQPQLADELANAREAFRDSCLLIIQHATLADGRPDWRAAAWLLERTFPTDYARPKRPPVVPPDPEEGIPKARPAGPENSWADLSTEVEKGVIILAAEKARRQQMGEPAWDAPVNPKAKPNPADEEPEAAELTHRLRHLSLETPAGVKPSPVPDLPLPEEPSLAPTPPPRRDEDQRLADLQARIERARRLRDQPEPSPVRHPEPPSQPEPCATSAAELIPPMRTQAQWDALNAILNA